MIKNLNLFIKSSINFSRLRIILLVVILLTGFFLGNIYHQKYSKIYVKYIYDYPEPMIIDTQNAQAVRVTISAANLFNSAKTLLADEIQAKCEFRNLKIESTNRLYFSISLKLDDYIFLEACENAFSKNLKGFIDGEFTNLSTKMLENSRLKIGSNPIKSQNISFVYKENIGANIIVTDTLFPSSYATILISGLLFATLAQLIFVLLSFFRRSGRLISAL